MPAAAEKSSAGSMVSFETALTSTVCLHEPSKPPVVPNGHTRSPPNHTFSPTLSPKPCLKRDIQPNQKKLEDFARSGSHQGSVLSPQMYTMETERHKPGSRRPRRRLIFRLCLAMVLATVAVLVVWILYRSVFFSSDDPVVRGRFGAVRGVRINVKDGNTLISLHAFYAIPYAKAPVGALRFRKPSGWSHHFIDPNFNDGNATSEKVKNAREYDLDVIDCTEKRGPCPQNGFLYGNRNVKLENWTEDCLHINIWAPPADCSNRHVKCGNNTVLFFLHGGSFQNGGNSLELVLAGYEAGATALGFHMYSGPSSIWTTSARRFILLSGGPFRKVHVCLAIIVVTIAVLVLSVIYVFSTLSRIDDPVIHGHFGAVRGVLVQVQDENRAIPLYAFYAIPYAKAPVGQLRFRKPRERALIGPQFLKQQDSEDDGVQPQGEHDNVNETANNHKGKGEPSTHFVVDCRKKRGPCPQKDFLVGTRKVKVKNWSEDCLHLNIWAPPVDCSSSRQCGNNTVLLFLHGGAFQNGGNSFERYDGSYLAALGRLVVVVPNYRLGVFGYPWSPEVDGLIPTNVGLEDQTLALSWTLQNIGYFGGNPKKLVIAGHEAGATALGFHMYSTPDNLWITSADRFILLSGGPFQKYQATAAGALGELARRLKCPSDGLGSLRCLQQGGASLVVNEAPAFWPLFEKPPIERSTAELFSDQVKGIGPHNKEILVVRTAREGFLRMFQAAISAAPFTCPSPWRLAKELLSPVFGTHQWIKAFGDEVDVQLLHNITFAEAEAAVTRAMATCPMRYLADIAYTAKNTVYGFVLDNRRNFSSWFDRVAEAAAFGELHYVFGMPLRPGVSSSIGDKMLSRNMIRMFSTFAKQGVPVLGDTALPKYVHHGMFVLLDRSDTVLHDSVNDSAICDDIVDMYKANGTQR
ncbi:cholinesterase-like isoform X2 [Ornithodoros turicata]|uniref:cholinesterase-like isoform X2 n=1 Tax=Ornithodoros turicata TaxID=34597 RepID=UPI0031397036